MVDWAAGGVIMNIKRFRLKTKSEGRSSAPTPAVFGDEADAHPSHTLEIRGRGFTDTHGQILAARATPIADQTQHGRFSDGGAPRLPVAKWLVSSRVGA